MNIKCNSHSFRINFTVPHRLYYVILSLLFSSRQYLISFLIYFVIHCNSIVLFNLHVFAKILYFLLLLISNINVLWTNNMHGLISIILCLLKQILWAIIGLYRRKFHFRWEECLFFCCAEEHCRYLQSSFVWRYASMLVFLFNFLSDWCVCLWRRDIKVLLYNSVDNYLIF